MAARPSRPTPPCRPSSRPAGSGGGSTRPRGATRPSSTSWKTTTPSPGTRRPRTGRLVELMGAGAPGQAGRGERRGRPPDRRLRSAARCIEDGQRRQRAELRFDGLAGCLRTPRGGSSRQILVVVDGERVRSRTLTAREGARLMGPARQLSPARRRHPRPAAGRRRRRRPGRPLPGRAAADPAGCAGEPAGRRIDGFDNPASLAYLGSRAAAKPSRESHGRR